MARLFVIIELLSAGTAGPPATRRESATPVSRTTWENDESALKVQVTVAAAGLGRDPLASRVSNRQLVIRPFAPISMFELWTKVEGSRCKSDDSTRLPARA